MTCSPQYLIPVHCSAEIKSTVEAGYFCFVLFFEEAWTVNFPPWYLKVVSADNAKYTFKVVLFRLVCLWDMQTKKVYYPCFDYCKEKNSVNILLIFLETKNDHVNLLGFLNVSRKTKWNKIETTSEKWNHGNRPASAIKKKSSIKAGVIERHAIYATTHWENQDGIQPARNIGIIVMKKRTWIIDTHLFFKQRITKPN